MTERSGASSALRHSVRGAGRLLATRRGVVWLILVAAAAGGLMLVPQFNLLNYYFSLASAFLVGIAAAHVGLAAGRSLRADAGAAPPLAPRVAGAAAVAAVTFALLPLAVVTLNALRVRNCDYLGGLAFYAMGPVFGGVYAAMAGVAAGALSRRAWVRRLAFAALVVFAVLVPFWRFLAQPPVHFYHPVLGYFSGAVYDEVIEITRPFFVYRLTDLVEIGALVTGLVVCRDPATGDWRWPWRSGAPRARVVWFGVALGAALVGVAFPGVLGYRYDRDAIRAALGGHLQTPHFDVWYAGGTPYEGVVGRVAGECERAYAGIVDVFGRAPEDRTAVYIYPDSATKRRLMGADRVYIAKPWLGEVHLNRVGVDADVIRHELVHALGRVCAPGPLHVPARARAIPHMGLIEGIAEALEWSGGRLTLHEASAAMRRLGIAPDLRVLMGPEGFWTTQAGKAYVTAGSFLRFLLDRRGTAPVCAVYEAADFEAAYGALVAELATEWEAFLDDEEGLPLDDEALQLAADAFDRPSVFRKVCALEVARTEREAGRAATRRRFDEAARLLGVVARFDAGNPEKRLAWARSLLEADQLGPAVDAIETVLDDERSGRVLLLRAGALLGDVQWAGGEPERAAETYRDLLGEPLGPAERRLLQIKAQITSGPPARAEAFADLFVVPLRPSEWDARLTDIVESFPGDPVALYLLGRLRLTQGRAEDAASALTASLASGPLPTDVSREALRSLGIARFLAGDLDRAQSAFDSALEMARHEGERVDVGEWLARVAWWRAHPGGIPSDDF